MTDALRKNTSADEHAFVELATRYLDGQADDATMAALNEALRTNADYRDLFTFLSYEARLLHHAHAADVVPPAPVARAVEEAIILAPRKLRRVVYAAAAAAVLAACGLATYLLVPSDTQPERTGPQLPRSVATLIESTGGSLTTPTGYPVEGDDYPTGAYALDAGFAEFMMANAVNVKLRGTTRLHMHNKMNVSLTRGHAEFVVPRGAEGFTVHLPDGSRIVDLGTAFGVDVTDHGRRSVRVTQGVVRLDLTDLNGAERCFLVPAARLARLAVDAEKGTVLTQLVDAPSVITGVTATATSELVKTFDRVAAYAVDGSGLDPKTGHHTGIPDDAMWLSRGVGFLDSEGDDRHPAITFDLGDDYLLDALRVWNYNEVTGVNLFGRGIKDARILVSSDGESFTPLTDPADGDAVFTLHAAAGLGDTDFSQTMTLYTDSPVRFVRIEAVTTHEGSDFDAGTIADEGFAGLSEVRFSGSPVPNNIIPLEKDNTDDTK